MAPASPGAPDACILAAAAPLVRTEVPAQDAPVPPAQESATPAVRVAGIMVHRALAREGARGEEFAFFGTFNTLRVALELDLARVPAAAGRRLVSFSRADSTLTALRDDQGTDLAGEVDFAGPYELSPRLSQDGLGVLTVVGSQGRPDPAARELTLEGTLALVCASERGTETSEPAAVEAGSTYAVAGRTFEIVAVGESDWDPDKLELELRTQGSIDDVIAWALVGADGEVVPLEESSTFTRNDMRTKGLMAPALPEHAALQLELWTDAEPLQVPYAVTTGVGLR